MSPNLRVEIWKELAEIYNFDFLDKISSLEVGLHDVIKKSEELLNNDFTGRVLIKGERIMLRILFLFFLLSSGLYANEASDQLDPVMLHSPRATLKTFMTSMNKYMSIKKQIRLEPN